MVLTITGYQFSTAQEAVQFAEADEAQAIRINGKNIVVSKAEASRLESLGVRFSYLLTD
jgi:hypothetical protein